MYKSQVGNHWPLGQWPLSSTCYLHQVATDCGEAEICLIVCFPDLLTSRQQKQDAWNKGDGHHHQRKDWVHVCKLGPVHLAAGWVLTTQPAFISYRGSKTQIIQRYLKPPLKSPNMTSKTQLKVSSPAREERQRSSQTPKGESGPVTGS